MDTKDDPTCTTLDVAETDNVRCNLKFSLEPLLAVELMFPIESMVTAPYQVQERILCLIMATARPPARRPFRRAATVMVKVLIRWCRRSKWMHDYLRQAVHGCHGGAACKQQRIYQRNLLIASIVNEYLDLAHKLGSRVSHSAQVLASV